MRLDELRKKQCIVLGLGISGYESAVFLHKHKVPVFVSERATSDTAKKFAAKLQKKGIPYELGKHSMDRLLSADLIIISPGISPYTPIMQELRAARKQVISEIELASWFCRGRIVAITGTNGKTTVTTLTAEVLKAAGRDVHCCGNIGDPFIACAMKGDENTYFVIELSSFQLFYSESFRPHVGVLLNVAEDHLDWHKDMDEYAEAKMRMFYRQTASDTAIINTSCKALVKPYVPRIPSHVVFYNTPVSRKGFANENMEVIARISEAVGVGKPVYMKVIKNFKGFEHRIEFTRKIKGVSFYNDSKSTTPHSLEWALRTFAKKVILITGGKNKGLSFHYLKGTIQKKVKQVVLMGACKDEIYEAWKGAVPMTMHETLQDAISTAFKSAKPGDAVLFSPATASFDMFKNYKDRGKKFKAYVSRL